MNATRTITGKTSKGQAVEIKLERTIDVQEKIGFADGWNINLGKETIDLTSIEVFVDGKFYTRSLGAPGLVDPKFDKSGAYARLGDMYISQARYSEIMSAIAEMDAELTTPEYTEIKTIEIAREQSAELALDAEAAEYARQIENGLCQKCDTYCYGDCEANQ